MKRNTDNTKNNTQDIYPTYYIRGCWYRKATEEEIENGHPFIVSFVVDDDGQPVTGLASFDFARTAYFFDIAGDNIFHSKLRSKLGVKYIIYTIVQVIIFLIFLYFAFEKYGNELSKQIAFCSSGVLLFIWIMYSKQMNMFSYAEELNNWNHTRTQKMLDHLISMIENDQR